MTTTHEDWTFRIGDTWQVDYHCQEADGSPMALPPGTLLSWKLDDANETHNWAARSDAAGITITDADVGICRLVFDSRQATRHIIPGTYHDELTVTRAGVISTMCVGTIYARAKLK